MNEMVNEVFHRCDKYYLSYNPHPLADPLLGLFDNMLKSTSDKPETAICIKEPWKCLILYGDHREQMKPIAQDLETLKQYWKDRPNLKGETSDDLISEFQT